MFIKTDICAVSGIHLIEGLLRVSRYKEIEGMMDLPFRRLVYYEVQFTKE